MSNYQIKQTTRQDEDLIFWMFDEAIKYQHENHIIAWQGYDKDVLINDMNLGLQFKIASPLDEIECVFSYCLSDPIIWREKDQNNSIYLHRIVTHPQHKGKRQFNRILLWALNFCRLHKLPYVRMDTWAVNHNIIDYYKSFGFYFIENYILPDSIELGSQYRNLEVALLEYKIENI